MAFGTANGPTRFGPLLRAVSAASTMVRVEGPPARSPSGSARLQHGVLAEQADLEVARPIDHRAVRGEPAVGDAEHELRAHHPLDVDAVDHLLHGRPYLPGELELAEPERPPLAGRAEPAEKKPEQLP